MGTIRRLHAAKKSDILEALNLPGDLETSDYNTEEGWSIEPELLDVILKIVAHHRPHTVVEIGTYQGTTASAISNQLRRNRFGRLYTIDNGPEEDASFAASLFKKVDGQIVTQIRASSAEAFSSWGRARIDILIVDGGHDYLTSVTDLALWTRLLSEDGWIIVHDTVTRLLHRFPEDYLFPIAAFDTLDVVRLDERPSGHEWEGAAFIRFSDLTMTDQLVSCMAIRPSPEEP